MTQKDGIRLSIVQLERALSSDVEAPMTAFGDTMRAGRGPSEIELIFKTAGYAIPGRSLVSAAINSAGLLRSTGGLVGQCTAAFSGSVQTAGASVADPSQEAALSGALEPQGLNDGYLTTMAARAKAGDAAAQTFLATQALQERNQQFSLRYLQFQEEMQAESRQYTALSNIMKAKHDTAMNIINNMK